MGRARTSKGLAKRAFMEKAIAFISGSVAGRWNIKQQHQQD